MEEEQEVEGGEEEEEVEEGGDGDASAAHQVTSLFSSVLYYVYALLGNWPPWV